MPRTPPHFKVRTSIKNHEKMGAVYADPWLLSLWVKLGVEAIERFADRTGDTFQISDRELIPLTGKGRADVARTLLRHLADVSPISAEHRGDVWLITFPNFAKKQGFARKNGVGMGPSATATATATERGVEDPPLSSPRAPTARVPPAGKSKPKRLTPEALEGLDVATLPIATAARLKAVRPYGREPTDLELACWFAWVAPRMLSKGYKSPVRCAGRWWPNVTLDEIKRAREWVWVLRDEPDRLEAERTRDVPVDPEILAMVQSKMQIETWGPE